MSHYESGSEALMLIGTDLELGRVDYTSKYITEEPDAVVPHVRICVGAVQVTGRSTMTNFLALLVISICTILGTK